MLAIKKKRPGRESAGHNPTQWQSKGILSEGVRMACKGSLR